MKPGPTKTISRLKREANGLLGTIDIFGAHWESIDRHAAKHTIGYAIGSLDGAEYAETAEERAKELKKAREYLQQTRTLKKNPPSSRPPKMANLHSLFKVFDEPPLCMGETDYRKVEKNLNPELRKAKALLIVGGIQKCVEVFLDNGLRAAEQAGRPGETRLHAAIENGHLVVKVIDKGAGIEPEHQKKVFNEEFSLNKRTGGHGFGLTAVKEMVEKHGGTVFFESEHGKGSTFGFRIPLKPAAQGKQ